MGKFSSRKTGDISPVFPGIGFDISRKLSPKETICKKCQILFYFGKYKKTISKCRLLKCLPSMLSDMYGGTICRPRRFKYFRSKTKQEVPVDNREPYYRI